MPIREMSVPEWDLHLVTHVLAAAQEHVGDRVWEAPGLCPSRCRSMRRWRWRQVVPAT